MPFFTLSLSLCTLTIHESDPLFFSFCSISAATADFGYTKYYIATELWIVHWMRWQFYAESEHRVKWFITNRIKLIYKNFVAFSVDAYILIFMTPMMQFWPHSYFEWSFFLMMNFIVFIQSTDFLFMPYWGSAVKESSWRCLVLKMWRFSTEILEAFSAQSS